PSPAPPPSSRPTLSLHDALPIWSPTASFARSSPVSARSGTRFRGSTSRSTANAQLGPVEGSAGFEKLATSLVLLTSRKVLLRVLDRKSTRLNSSHVSISYAVFCL